MVAVAAAGCGGGSDQPAGAKRPVVGVTLLTQTHSFFKDLEEGLREEAAKQNLDLIVVACEMDPAKQAAQIEDFVAQKVSAILAAPCDSSAIVPQLAAPDRAGIPVFTADIAARGGHVVSHVASDNVQGGRLAATALAELIGDTGKVIIIDHPTVASVQDRVRASTRRSKQHPGITIVAAAVGGRAARARDGGDGGHAAGASRPEGRVRHQRRLGARRDWRCSRRPAAPTWSSSATTPPPRPRTRSGAAAPLKADSHAAPGRRSGAPRST